MPPILIVIPTQGLCNRLRAIASTHILASYLDTDYYINWYPEDCCNCHLTDLIMNDFKSYDLNSISNNKTILFKPDIHTNNLISSMDKYDYIIIKGGHEFKHPDMSETSFIHQKHLHYQSYTLSQTVDNILQRCDLIKDTVGIHFRDFIRTYDGPDGRIFNEVSPIETFIDMILKLYEKNTDIIFFISSNTDFAYNSIIKKIPNKNVIYLHNIQTDRNSTLGIIHAFVSLILLSRTKYIIGTFMSSFSDEACFFNKISKVCVGNEDRNSYHCYGYNHENKLLLPDLDKLDSIFLNNT